MIELRKNDKIDELSVTSSVRYFHYPRVSCENLKLNQTNRKKIQITTIGTRLKF